MYDLSWAELEIYKLCSCNQPTFSILKLIRKKKTACHVTEKKKNIQIPLSCYMTNAVMLQSADMQDLFHK